VAAPIVEELVTLEEGLPPRARRPLTRTPLRLRPTAVAVTAVLVAAILLLPGDGGGRPGRPGPAPSPEQAAAVVAPPGPRFGGDGLGSPGADVGPALDPDRLPPLPHQGLAVERDEGVVLVDLDRGVIGHLPGLRLDGTGAAGHLPGPLLVSRRGRRPEVLDPAVARVVPAPGEPLAAGIVLQPDRWLRRGGDLAWSLDRQAELVVSHDRDLVTQRFLQRAATRRSLALDVVTGRVRDLPGPCAATDRKSDRLLLSCQDGSRSTIEWLEPTGRRRVLIGAVAPYGEYWRFGWLSPDGSHLLAQWSGACGGVSYLLPAHGGPADALSGPGNESAALGWHGTHPVVELRRGPCGRSHRTPGVYRAGDDTEMLYPLGVRDRARLWGAVRSG
jgi:hypothetical protein